MPCASAGASIRSTSSAAALAPSPSRARLPMAHCQAFSSFTVATATIRSHSRPTSAASLRCAAVSVWMPIHTTGKHAMIFARRRRQSVRDCFPSTSRCCCANGGCCLSVANGRVDVAAELRRLAAFCQEEGVHAAITRRRPRDTLRTPSGHLPGPSGTPEGPPQERPGTPSEPHPKRLPEDLHLGP